MWEFSINCTKLHFALMSNRDWFHATETHILCWQNVQHSVALKLSYETSNNIFLIPLQIAST